MAFLKAEAELPEVARRKPGEAGELDRMLDTPAAADYLGVSTATLETWRCNRRYPISYVRMGRRVKYRVSELEKFIASRTVTIGGDDDQ